MEPRAPGSRRSTLTRRSSGRARSSKSTRSRAEVLSTVTEFALGCNLVMGLLLLLAGIGDPGPSASSSWVVQLLPLSGFVVVGAAAAGIRTVRRPTSAPRGLDDRDRAADEKGDDDRGARPHRGERRGDEENETGLDSGVVRSRVDRDEPETREAGEADRDRCHHVPHGRSSKCRSASAPSSRVRWYAAYTAFDSTVRSAPFSSW